LAVLVVQVVLAVWVVERRNCLPVVAVGSTTRSTVVALPMGIVERQTDLVVRLGETRWQIVKPAPGNRLAVRAAI
jgi:hypothetical protein